MTSVKTSSELNSMINDVIKSAKNSIVGIMKRNNVKVLNFQIKDYEGDYEEYIVWVDCYCNNDDGYDLSYLTKISLTENGNDFVLEARGNEEVYCDDDIRKLPDVYLDLLGTLEIMEKDGKLSNV